jgi:hypothetical protein
MFEEEEINNEDTIINEVFDVCDDSRINNYDE